MGFKTKPGTVNQKPARYVRITERNFDDIALWTNADIAESKRAGKRLRLRTRFGIRVARVGNWIFQEKETKEFSIVTEETAQTGPVTF